MKRWLRQHRVAMESALTRLWSLPLITFLSFLVIGVALSLPAAGYILMENISKLTAKTTNIQQISLYLKNDISEAGIDAIKKSLDDAKIVSLYISKKDAIKKLQQDGLSDILEALPENPLPDAFVIELGDLPAETVEKYAASFRTWHGVESVQLDSLWVKRFAAFLRIGKMFVLVLGAIFAVGTIAVTFNTIRLQVLYHSDEIDVAELIGATDAFIQRPFHYFGALQGFFGAIVAVLAVFTIIYFLNIPISELASLYTSRFTLQYPNLAEIASLLAIGSFLGWFGAYLSVNLSLLQLRNSRA